MKLIRSENSLWSFVGVSEKMPCEEAHNSGSSRVERIASKILH